MVLRTKMAIGDLSKMKKGGIKWNINFRRISGNTEKNAI